MYVVWELIYVVVFLIFGWIELYGFWVIVFGIVLVGEILIMFVDFLEEDCMCKFLLLECIFYMVLVINYGVFLVFLILIFWGWV